MHSSSAATGTVSRIGGPSSVPGDQPLPLNDLGEELDHMLTLNLSEVLMAWPDCRIGKFGENLSFYLSTRGLEQRWPDQAADRAIRKYDAVDEVKPKPAESPGKSIWFQPFLDLPFRESSIMDTADFSDDEKDLYEAILEIYLLYVFNDSRYEDRNKLFGYSDMVQICPALEAEMAAKKIEYADLDPIETNKWLQLFQIATSDQSLEYSEAFAGAMIYVMIQKDHLEEGNFANVQVVVQNT